VVAKDTTPGDSGCRSMRTTGQDRHCWYSYSLRSPETRLWTCQRRCAAAGRPGYRQARVKSRGLASLPQVEEGAGGAAATGAVQGVMGLPTFYNARADAGKC